MPLTIISQSHVVIIFRNLAGKHAIWPSCDTRTKNNQKMNATYCRTVWSFVANWSNFEAVGTAVSYVMACHGRVAGFWILNNDAKLTNNKYWVYRLGWRKMIPTWLVIGDDWFLYFWICFFTILVFGWSRHVEACRGIAVLASFWTWYFRAKSRREVLVGRGLIRNKSVDRGTFRHSVAYIFNYVFSWKKNPYQLRCSVALFWGVTIVLGVCIQRLQHASPHLFANPCARSNPSEAN